jgi:hypothetical protein
MFKLGEKQIGPRLDERTRGHGLVCFRLDRADRVMRA